MNLERLRLETQSEHRATESAMPFMAALTRAEYVSSLQSLHSIVSGWESWVDGHVPEDLRELAKERQRGHLLERDLRALGAKACNEVHGFPAEEIPGLLVENAEFRASFLGAMYVMEGSTLGGQHIARHLDGIFSHDLCCCNTYFRGHGERTGAMWRAFKDLMACIPSEEEDHVIGAAKAMFAVIRRRMLA